MMFYQSFSFEKTTVHKIKSIVTFKSEPDRSRFFQTNDPRYLSRDRNLKNGFTSLQNRRELRKLFIKLTTINMV